MRATRLHKGLSSLNHTECPRSIWVHFIAAVRVTERSPFVIKLKTAKLIGLDISQTLLAITDMVMNPS